MNACKKGHYEIAKLLLQSHADPNICRDSGRTALMSAREAGRYEVVQLLLKYGAQVDMKDVTLLKTMQERVDTSYSI